MRVGPAAVSMLALALIAVPAIGGELEEDSGVSVQTVCTNCNNADLTVGGLGNDYVPIRCDGIFVPPGLGQIYLLSVMPQTLVDKVAVKRGAGDAALDGGAVGGGIEIERFRPEEKVQLNLSGDAGSYGWNGQRLDVRGRHGWFGGTLAATRGRSDAINANDDAPGGYQNWDLPEFDRTTWEARFDLQPHRMHAIRFGVASYDESQKNGRAAYDSSTSITVGSPVYNLENVELARRQYDVGYDGRLPDGSHLEIGVFRAQREEDILETQIRTLPQFIPTYVINETEDAVHASWSRAFGLHWKARAGASWSSRDAGVVDVVFNALSGLPPERWFDEAFDETVTETGIWAESEWSPRSTVDLVVGVRRADFSYEDEEARAAWIGIPLPEGSKTLPRAALTWKPSPAWTLRATAGAGYRPPPATYAEVCCGRRYRNNRGVLMESSRAYGVETTWQPGPKVRLNATVSLTDFDDLVVKLATLTFQYRPTYQNANAPKARFENLSLEGRWEAAKWLTVKGSYSWLSAENRSENDRVVALIDFFGTPFSRDYPMAKIPYRASRNGALGGDFRIPGAGTTFSLSMQYTGPMFIQTFDADNPVVEPGYLSETQDFLVRTPDFFLWNVRVEQRLPKGVFVYAGVDNLTDEFQNDLSDPRFDYNWGSLRGRYLYGGLGWTFDR